jgi:hypothetical protein
MGITRNEYKIVVKQTEGKKPLGRLGIDGEDTVEMDFREI